MQRMNLRLSMALVAGIALGTLGSGLLSAQDPLAAGKILQRTELVGDAGLEALLVLHELPAGGESGKHTQSGNEIVYILEGSVTLEVDGKAPVTLKAGEAFQTSAGEVHNVKNASASAAGKALAFYITKKGAGLEELSVPAK